MGAFNPSMATEHKFIGAHHWLNDITPIPPPRKYPECTEEGLRELWLSIDTRDLTWESLHRAVVRCMDDEERIKVEKMFKDPATGGYKKRAPSMMEFINLILDIPFLNEWEFERQDNFTAFVRNLENRVELAKLLDGVGEDYRG